MSIEFPSGQSSISGLNDIMNSELQKGGDVSKKSFLHIPNPQVLIEKDSADLKPAGFKSAKEQYAALDDVVSATGKLLAEISRMAAEDRKMNKEIIRQQYETIEQTALSEAKKLDEGAMAQLICGIVGSAVQIASGAFSIYSSSKALASEVKAHEIQNPAAKDLTRATDNVQNLERTGKLGQLNDELKTSRINLKTAEDMKTATQDRLNAINEKLEINEKLAMNEKLPQAEVTKLNAEKTALTNNLKSIEADISKYQQDVTTASKNVEHFTSTDKTYCDAKEALAVAKNNSELADAMAKDLTVGNRARHGITEAVTQGASAFSNVAKTSGDYIEQEKRADVKRMEAKEASLRGAIESLKEINDSLKELQTKARDTIQDISRSENDATRKIVTV